MITHSLIHSTTDYLSNLIVIIIWTDYSRFSSLFIVHNNSTQAWNRTHKLEQLIRRARKTTTNWDEEKLVA